MNTSEFDCLQSEPFLFAPDDISKRQRRKLIDLGIAEATTSGIESSQVVVVAARLKRLFGKGALRHVVLDTDGWHTDENDASLRLFPDRAADPDKLRYCAYHQGARLPVSPKL